MSTCEPGGLCRAASVTLAEGYRFLRRKDAKRLDLYHIESLDRPGRTLCGHWLTNAEPVPDKREVHRLDCCWTCKNAHNKRLREAAKGITP